MCATYVTKLTRAQWKESYGIDIDDPFIGIDEKIVPFKMAPILRIIKEQMGVVVAQFSLIPNFSDSSKPKFATFNARIETVDEKATWKNPWRRYHSVTPITDFIEPIYTGTYAGNMVNFRSGEVLHAASIYNDWVNKSTGEILPSFALLMRDGLPFVQSIGHERSPIFIKSSAVREWLAMCDQPDADMKNFLFNNLAAPDLTVSVDRPMAKGWEKRIPKT